MHQFVITSKLARSNTGKAAEDLISSILVNQGWYILKRNLRHIGCELDIVARKGSTIVIVEVKARARLPKSERDMSGLLTYRKRLALKKGATIVATRFARPNDTIRIDLATVYPDAQEFTRVSYQVSAVED